MVKWSIEREECLIEAFKIAKRDFAHFFSGANPNKQGWEKIRSIFLEFADVSADSFTTTVLINKWNTLKMAYKAAEVKSNISGASGNHYLVISENSEDIHQESNNNNNSNNDNNSNYKRAKSNHYEELNDILAGCVATG